MSDKHTHKLIGVLSSLLIEGMKLSTEDGVKDGKEIFGRLASSAAGGLLGSLAPDKFEPADSPHHRSLCHSWIALSGSVYAISKTINNMGNVNPHVAAFTRGLSVGYTSHLLLDAKTPKGLPVIK